MSHPLRLGWKASAEQFGPRQLLDFAILAEEVGFDSVWVSDHYQPWRHTDGHSPFSMAWLAAAQVDGLSAASSYYGSMVQANAALSLKCPTIVHLGRTDPGIPADEVAATVAQHHADVPVYIYEGAGHGFNNQSPERYNAEAADLARHRTLELFDNA